MAARPVQDPVPCTFSRSALALCRRGAPPLPPAAAGPPCTPARLPLPFPASLSPKRLTPCCQLTACPSCPPAGATALVKLQAPQADELGFARSLAVREIGGTKCMVLQQDSSMGQISTVVLRGSTDQVSPPGWQRQGGGGVASGLGSTA